MHRTLSTLLLVLGLVASAAIGARAADSETPSGRDSSLADVVFVPTPNDVVLKMLEMAKVGKDDVLYDLGCGDCRIPVLAAKKFGCRGVGYDIDPQRIKESKENIKKNGVEKLVQVERENIFKLDLSPASVVTLYLLPTMNVKLIPQLEKLKPGSRIVAHDFDMAGVKPDKVLTMTSKETNREHTIYLWTVPLKKEKKAVKSVEE